MRRFALIAALALAACTAQDPEAAREEKFRKDMAAATKEARSHIAYFWEHYEAPLENEFDFLLKVDFPATGGEEKTEALWVEDIARDGAKLSGVMSTEPRYQGDRKKGDVVEFGEKQVVDWAFFQGEKLMGHYTTRVMLPRLPADQAEAMASMFGENPQ